MIHGALDPTYSDAERNAFASVQEQTITICGSFLNALREIKTKGTASAMPGPDAQSDLDRVGVIRRAIDAIQMATVMAAIERCPKEFGDAKALYDANLVKLRRFLQEDEARA